MEKISVIIPVYNRMARIAGALNSVLAQKGSNFEVIVVDDGSTDGVSEIIRNNYPGVKFVRQENRGPAAARNTGAKLSQGRWIAFLDSDDEWLPGKLAAQQAFSAAHPEMRIHQTEEIWIRNGKRVNPMNKHRKEGGNLFERSLDLCLISPSAVMIRRDLFHEMNGFNESYPACEDYELWLRITAKYAVGLINKPYVVRYGGHEDQLSRKFPAMDRFRIRAMMELLKAKSLTPEQTRIAMNALRVKSTIYAEGAKKRGKSEEAESLLQSIQDL